MNYLCGLILFFLELIFLVSFLPSAAGTASFDFKPFLIIQSVIFLTFVSFYTRRFLSVSITFTLLIISNFAITPSTLSNAIKLPKNLSQKVQVEGSLLTGFSGISNITTDSHGFRTLDQVNYDQKSGKFRIFAIGGSTTEQILLDDKKTWTHLLSQKLNSGNNYHVEVINAGFSGPRAENHYYTLKAIERYQPDLVIFLMGINDWNNDIRMQELLRNPLKRIINSIFNWMPFSNHFRFEYSPIGLLKNRLFNFQNYALSNTDIRIEKGDMYAKQNHSLNRKDVRDIRLNEPSASYQYWVNELIGECQGKGIDCVFIDQPTAYTNTTSNDLKDRLWMTPPGEVWTLPLSNMIDISSMYNQFLIGTASKAKMPSCAISTKLPASTTYLYDDCHYNEKGAQLMSDLIYQCVLPTIKTKLVPKIGQ
jgi:lysophospholipase L1-like esterase